ncbi:MAG: CBS domain-containing protein [Desulfobacteraceae bacterium]|nr:CBS domain-containing protein [Pseudomonadota bacterium]MCG2754176.1 CBS domain-containing protein [Desulfobacteraceae bacterium]
MKRVEKVTENTNVAELVALLKKRRVPIIHENAYIKEVVDIVIGFEPGRFLYVVDDEKKLVGCISLGTLAKHVFAPSHEPQIHPRFLIDMITAETAKDIMKRKTVVATENEQVGMVLQRMIRTNVHEMPVVDDEKRVVADITLIDLLRFLVK